MSTPVIPLSRRSLLTWMALGAVGAGTDALGADKARVVPASPRPPRPLRILILGGTSFLGPATVEFARARGHTLTLFHRGRTRPSLFPDIEKLHGDRDPRKEPGLSALSGRSFDVVIDNSGYYPRMVAASANLLAPRVSRYIYISSISAYAEPNPESGDEDAPLATLADPTVETMGKDFANYGGLKALCEQAAQKAMPGKVTLVRPGYIVGPDDPTGRFTYWPARFQRGGTVAVPGAPTDPLQVIDVRDLGAWLVRLAEDKAVGAYNAVGMTERWGDVITLCQRTAPVPAALRYVAADFVAAHAGFEFPIWAENRGKTRGVHTWRNARALAAGLRLRPVSDTVRDLLAWYKAQGAEPPGQGRTRLDGPTGEQELALLKAWDKVDASRPAAPAPPATEARPIPARAP